MLILVTVKSSCKHSSSTKNVLVLNIILLWVISSEEAFSAISFIKPLSTNFFNKERSRLRLGAKSLK